MDEQLYFELFLIATVGMGAILYLAAPWISADGTRIHLIRKTGMVLIVAAASLAVFAILLLPELHLVPSNNLP